MTTDVRQLVSQGTMSGFQLTAVGICVLLNMLDGFDALATAYTASAISAEWSLTGTQLGTLLSAGVFGMTAGCLVIAPLADHLGRRNVILFGLVLLTVGMLASANVAGPAELGAWRFITGLGIGALLASLTIIASEYSPERRRGVAIGLLSTGFTIGATVGGSIAAALIDAYGWRSVYIAGGIASAVMLPVVWLQLPESMDFLVTKRPKDALPRLNRLLRRMGHAPLASLPERTAAETAAVNAGVVALLKGATLRITLLLWLAFFCVMTSYYFVVSWTPKLLGALQSPAAGIQSGVAFNFGCMLGALAFAGLSTKVAVRPLTLGLVSLAAAAVGLLGWSAAQADLSLVMAFAAGFGIFGAVSGLYTLVPALYPPTGRATGLGIAVGVGRIGGILAPLIAGVLLDGGLQTQQLYYLCVVPLVLAVVSVRLLR